MKESDLVFFKDWFADFCRSFYLDNAKEQKNITMKEVHTRNVCDNIVSIARGESAGISEIMLAESIGLFHDVGRFPQYTKYKTFRDSISVNHGVLGADTLAEKGILDRLPASEQEIVINAVKFHNAFAPPDLDDQEKLYFLKMVRDADKLDIWRAFIDFYKSPEEDRPDAVGLGLPDVPSYSSEVLSFIRKREIIPLTSLRTMTDLKLLQLSWTIDLNFRTSFVLLDERDYIGKIASMLPQTGEIIDTIGFVRTHLQEMLTNG